MMIIDPPEGWLYGFPKELPDGVEDINVWLAENGYPQGMIDQFGGKVPCRFFYKKKDLL